MKKSCNICNDKDTYIFKDCELENIFYTVCRKCNFIQKTKECFVDEKRELQQYLNHNNTFESIGYVKMFEKFLEFCSFKIEGKNILEFGCGPGPVLAKILSDKGAKVTKYDKFFYNNQSYKKRKYDIITSTEVFEHLPNPKQTFLELSSLLKPNGFLAIMTNFHSNDPKVFLQWWYRRDPTHISFFHLETFDYLSKECGLKLIKSDKKKIVLFRKLNH